MNPPRLLLKALLILLLWAPWSAVPARADETPNQLQLIVNLHELTKQQGEINDQLKKIRDAVTKDILSDKPPDKKAKEARQALQEELATKEEQLARRFDETTKQLLVLQREFEKIDNATSREKAATLRAVLKVSETRSIPDQFKKLTADLKTGSFEQLASIQKVRTQSETLNKDLMDLMVILSQEDPVTELQRALKECKKRHLELQQLATEQKALQNRTAVDGAKADELLKVQSKLTVATRSLSKEPNPLWGMYLKDVVAFQEKSEQAFKDGKITEAFDHQKKALAALEDAKKRIARIEIQIEEEIAERATKKPR